MVNDMGVQLFRGDCLELMKEIPDGSVDMVLTSPPYDNLRDYNGNIKQWTFEKFKKIAVELFRIVKRGGIVVWIVADATIKGSETGTSFKHALHFIDCGFRLHDTMIWDKRSSGGIGSMNRYENVFEYMFVLSKGKPSSVNLIMDKPNKRAGEIWHGTIREKTELCENRLDMGKKLFAILGDGTMCGISHQLNQN